MNPNWSEFVRGIITPNLKHEWWTHETGNCTCSWPYGVSWEADVQLDPHQDTTSILMLTVEHPCTPATHSTSSGFGREQPKKHRLTSSDQRIKIRS
jgi:hypothetical protein